MDVWHQRAFSGRNSFFFPVKKLTGIIKALKRIDMNCIQSSCNYKETPTEIDRVPCPIDDYHPRAQLKHLFEDENLFFRQLRGNI